MWRLCGPDLFTFEPVLDGPLPSVCLITQSDPDLPDKTAASRALKYSWGQVFVARPLFIVRNGSGFRESTNERGGTDE